MAGEEADRHGFAQKLGLKCRHCGSVGEKVFSSPRINSSSSSKAGFVVNKLFVQFSKLLGRGFSVLQVFSTVFGKLKCCI